MTAKQYHKACEEIKAREEAPTVREQYKACPCKQAYYCSMECQKVCCATRSSQHS